MTPHPAPGLAFVRRIETAECYAGSSVIIPEQARDRVASSQYEIVSVGAPEPCDDEDCERFHYQISDLSGQRTGDREHGCDIKPHDWVLVRKRAAAATPDPDLFVIRQADCLGVFRETEA